MKRTALLLTTASLGYASAAPAPATATTDKPKAERKPRNTVEPTLTDAATVDISKWNTGRGGGVASKYDFDKLEVGQAFGVKNKTVREMASPVSAQNRKHATETKDDTGKVVSKSHTKHFKAIEVTAERAKELKGTALEGSKTLVFRDK